jgi:hypothetical protein
MRESQPVRLARYLREHPGASSLEVTLACDIVNVTGRISDLRAQGVEVVCRKRGDGRDGYWVLDRAQLELAL